MGSATRLLCLGGPSIFSDKQATTLTERELEVDPSQAPLPGRGIGAAGSAEKAPTSPGGAHATPYLLKASQNGPVPTHGGGFLSPGGKSESVPLGQGPTKLAPKAKTTCSGGAACWREPAVTRVPVPRHPHCHRGRPKAGTGGPPGTRTELPPCRKDGTGSHSPPNSEGRGLVPLGTLAPPSSRLGVLAPGGRS